jgi:hypothetical protein
MIVRYYIQFFYDNFSLYLEYLSSPRGLFSDQIQNDIVIHDILSDIITQVANSLNSITATKVTLVAKQQIGNF